jgi:putative membrane protein
MMDNGWGSGGWGWGAWVFMAIMMVIFFALVAGVLVALIRPGGWRGTGAGPQTDPGSSDALRILDERFARGEIDAEEYAQRRKLLRSQ